ncbi:MAG TPA: hypothetical protein VN754_04070 [Candidatus Binataceae bacterium]|nr:hypothetical protein [Candidatus Binataceae bacterium]
MLQSIYVAGLWLLLAGAISCAARRDYTADGQGLIDQQQPAGTYESQFQETAQQQADEATASIGNRSEVQDEARQAAGVLKGLVGLILQFPNANPRVVSGLTQDVAQLSSGLDAIADSHNDQEFTAAVFGMCEPEPVQASTRLGPLLIGLGARITTNPPPNAPGYQVTAWARYFDSLGEALVRIPQQCRHAQAAIAQVKAQAQTQAEVQNPAAKVRARRRHEARTMLLCIAAGMLAPSPNRSPIGAAARLGYGLEQCQ